MKKESVRKKQIDKDYAFERVPAASRKGFWPMLFIVLGFTFCSSSMTVGSKLGNGLDFSGYLLATTIGGVILSAYTGALGYIGSSSGLSFDHLAQRAFGKSGSYLPSAMVAVTQIGWFGVAVAMFAGPAAFQASTKLYGKATGRGSGRVCKRAAEGIRSRCGCRCCGGIPGRHIDPLWHCLCQLDGDRMRGKAALGKKLLHPTVSGGPDQMMDKGICDQGRSSDRQGRGEI